jgi:hypothetical protein
MQQPLSPAQWTPAKKILFRFFFALFLLYIFFNPNGVFPGSDPLFNIYIQPFHRLIPWIGRHILHLAKPITVFTNGSGDTTYDYLILLFLFVLAAFTCLIWSLLDRKRSAYNTLFYYLTTIVRYYLAFTMLDYGFVKVFKLQFPYPAPYRMLDPVGDLTPMGLAWTFMGFSKGYNLFTGFAEVLAGTLLLFRRTTTIGAFLALIVSLNIMAMNYCFDIPVKLLSSVMVFMSIYLLGDNIRRLFGLFFLRQTIHLSVTRQPAVRKKALRISLITLKTLLIGYIFIGYTVSALDRLHKYGDDAPHTPLYGIYNTKTFLLGKDSPVAVQTDSIRWRQLVIGGSPDNPYAILKTMDDSLNGFTVKMDTALRLLTISDYGDSSRNWRFHYRYPDKDNMILSGSRHRNGQSDSMVITLAPYPAGHFRLSSRGFHWISEYPYNR